MNTRLDQMPPSVYFLLSQQVNRYNTQKQVFATTVLYSTLFFLFLSTSSYITFCQHLPINSNIQILIQLSTLLSLAANLYFSSQLTSTQLKLFFSTQTLHTLLQLYELQNNSHRVSLSLSFSTSISFLFRFKTTLNCQF